MSKRIFTKEQIAELLSNPSVNRCSERSITFTKDFKVLALKRYYDEGLSASQIFREAGLNQQLIGKHTPKDCLRDWRNIFKAEGFSGLFERRGKNAVGRPQTKRLTSSDRIKYLEAEVAYLKAENSFLAKLRAKRRE